MTIGEKIKYLRQKNSVTQETLAEYLNITYQSISKWENNNALPDISLVVPLANFFGVSIDELFDRNVDGEEEAIKEYNEKDKELARQGLVKEQVALWRSAVLKYPRSYKSLQMLANCLWTLRNDPTIPEEERTRNIKESVEINERILSDCTDDAVRYSALQILVYSYGDPSLPCANEEKAVEYAKKCPVLYASQNLLLEHAYFSEEGKAHAKETKHQNILTFIDCATVRMVNQDYETPEERIRAYESALKIWDALIYDGNYLFYHCRVEIYYRKLAKNYALLKNADKVIENLKLAKHHAMEFDRQPCVDQNYTSLFVSQAHSNAGTTRKNYTQSHLELFMDDLTSPCFDFLRSSPEFIELMQ
ncbi:MAG: helix-turn-helix transcriptional regulator [Clostridia bacterium]|nr:helix-turn-helix transcriptional regulator [Clostridia bacterium]